MRIEAVIFDIGNVLVEWHPERMYDTEIGETRRVELFANVDLYAMNDRVDLGEDIATLVAELAAQHSEFHDEIMLWNTKWLDMLRPDIPHSAKLLRALRTKGVPTYALSNFGTTTLDLAATIIPVLTEFDQRFVSGHLKMMKPDPAIYAHVEAHVPQSADRLLFIDDRPENLEAASNRGWHTQLFEHPQGLADRLIAEGLLTSAEAAA